MIGPFAAESARDLRGAPEVVLHVEEVERDRLLRVAAGDLEPAFLHLDLRRSAVADGHGVGTVAEGHVAPPERERLGNRLPIGRDDAARDGHAPVQPQLERVRRLAVLDVQDGVGVGVQVQAGAKADPHLDVARREVQVVGAGALHEQVPRAGWDDQGERAVGPADGLDRRQPEGSRVAAARLDVADPAADDRRAGRVLDQPAAHQDAAPELHLDGVLHGPLGPVDVEPGGEGTARPPADRRRSRTCRPARG